MGREDLHRTPGSQSTTAAFSGQEDFVNARATLGTLGCFREAICLGTNSLL